MEMLVVLGLFVVLAVLGPVIGADSRVPGGWTPPTEPAGKIWPDPLREPDRPSRNTSAAERFGTSVAHVISRLTRRRSRR